MPELIPAILQKSLLEITKQLEQIRGLVPLVQLDVVDGFFAQEKSWPFTPEGDREFSSISSGTQGLPFWEDFDFEIDLMVKKSARDAEAWVSAGVSRIVIHADSPDAAQALESLQPSRHISYPIGVGVALTLRASPRTLSPFEGLFDYIQVMGIAHMGKQGEPFDLRTTELIRALSKAYPSVPLQVDGGVREETLKEILRAGATRLVVGSAIFAHGAPRKNLEHLKEKVDASVLA